MSDKVSSGENNSPKEMMSNIEDIWSKQVDEICRETEWGSKRRFKDAILRFISMYFFALLLYDPMQIFKGTHKSNSTRFCLYLRPELRMKSNTSWDKFREVSRKFIYLFRCFILFRYLMLIIVIICSIYTRSIEQQSKSTTDDKRISMTIARIVSSWGNRFGNALSSVPELGLIFYSTSCVVLIYAFFYIPEQYVRKPMDSAYSRFLFEPMRELRRVDLDIRYKLSEILHGQIDHDVKFDSINSSMNDREKSTIDFGPLRMGSASEFMLDKRRTTLRQDDKKQPEIGLGLKQSFLQQSKKSNKDLIRYEKNPIAAENIIANERHLLIVRERLELIRRQRQSLLTGDNALRIIEMRPEIYGVEWFYESYDILQYIILSIVVVALILAVKGPQLIMGPAARLKCRILYSSEDCSYVQVFSLADMINMVELILGVTALGLVVTVQYITVISCMVNQIKLVGYNKGNIQDCLELIRQINYKQMQLLPDRKKPTKSYDKHYHLYDKLKELNGFHLDRILCKSLVKLTISETDRKYSSKFVSEYIDGLVTISGSFVFALMLATKSPISADLAGLITSGLIFFWTEMNILLIFAARIFALSRDVEKVAWSLLAQLSIRSKLLDRTLQSDPIAFNWTKLVRSYKLSDVRSTFHLFSKHITFETVLELNFIVISIGLLLYNH